MSEATRTGPSGGGPPPDAAPAAQGSPAAQAAPAETTAGGAAAGGVGERGQRDLTRGPVLRSVLGFAVPLTLSNLLQQTYLLADGAVLGHWVGVDALAAAGVVQPVYFLADGVFLGLTTGFAIRLARFTGERSRRGPATVATALALATAVWAALCFLAVQTAGGALLRLTGARGAVLHDAQVLLSTLSYGFPAVFAVSAVFALLRGLGDSRAQMRLMIGSSLGNAVLAWFYVVVLHLGVAGAGLATVTAATGTAAAGAVLLRRRGGLAVRRSHGWAGVRAEAVAGLRLGLPGAAQQLLIALGIVALIRIVAPLGPSLLAAVTVVGRLEFFAATAFLDLSGALTVFTAQNLGAGRPDRVRRAVRRTLPFTLALALAVSLAVIVLRPVVAAAATTDPVTRHLVERYILVTYPCFALYAVMAVVHGALNGIGRTVVPLVCTLVSFVAVRLPLSYLLRVRHGADGVMWAVDLGWIVGALYTAFAVRRHLGRPGRHPAGRPALPGVPWRRVLAPLLCACAVLVAAAGRYGYFRDELYWLAASRHLAAGYDDQPPLVPLIVRVETWFGGDSVQVVRIAPMLFAVATALMTVLCARELAGPDERRSHRAQQIAAVAVSASVLVLVEGHLFTTASSGLFFWSVAIWLVLRILRTGDHRLWYGFGAVLGVGMLNNDTIVMVPLSLLVAAPLTGRTRLLRERAVWLSVLLALAIASPDLLWQAAHGWPQFTMAGHLSSWAKRLTALPLQVEAATALTWLWVVGWRLAWQDTRYRLLAVGYAVTLAIVVVSGGNFYYPMGWYPLLLGAGAVRLADRWPSGRRWFAASAAAAAAVTLALGPPLLPVSAYRHLIAVNPFNADSIGWPELAREVAEVERRHPGATLLAVNYGEAGALAHYGPALGLPTVYADHNGYSHFGRPTGVSATTIAVGYDPRALRPYWRSCVVAGHVDNGQGVPNIEQGLPILVCTGQEYTWEQLWPLLKHYN
ncbi:MATE family efflux transporter [Kitasatospora phosalacinea]|uniref:MATE family efflux transporter n=1 Tax=Kitasatospora phosalacinea TaxID=2065 RepID=UPI0009E011F4|nr:MATE family efflux transporter [Kitasatospora phosalacinea]